MSAYESQAPDIRTFIILAQIPHAISVAEIIVVNLCENDIDFGNVVVNSIE